MARIPDWWAESQDATNPIPYYGKCSVCGQRCYNRVLAERGYCSQSCRTSAVLERAARERDIRVSLSPKKRIPCKACGCRFIQDASLSRYCCAKCEANGPAILVTSYTLFERDFFRCVYCGRSSIEDGVKLQLDHIIPRSQGGPDHAGNLVTACSSCNASKGPRIHRKSVLSRLKQLALIRSESINLRTESVVKMVG